MQRPFPCLIAVKLGLATVLKRNRTPTSRTSSNAITSIPARSCAMPLQKIQDPMRHCCGRDRTLSIRLRPPSCCLSLRTSITGLGARTTRTKRRLGLPKFDAILVGVEGLAGSKAALDWAVSEAQLFSLCAGTGSPSPKRREFWQCRPQQLEHGTNVFEKFRTPNLKWTSIPHCSHRNTP